MRLATVLGGLVATAASLAPLVAASSNPHDALHRRHRFALSARNASETEESALEKRATYNNERFTYYDITVGQVACEGWHKASEFVVALNAPQYGGYWKSPHCGASITISYGGKTANAMIVDECMGCPFGGLDFTQGLFEYFASTAEGVIYGDWSFNDGSGGGGNNDPAPAPAPKPKPTSTHKYTPPPPTSTTHKDPPPAPSTSHTPKPTSSDPPATSSAAKSSSAAEPSATAAGLPKSVLGSGLVVELGATVKVTDGNPQTLNQINYALYELGHIVDVA